MALTTEEDFFASLPIQLNTQQLAAIHSTEGPVLLLAVPGSGKTTTLVIRLGYMVYCKGVNPAQMLVITYTVAATQDLKKRCAFFFGEDFASRLEIRTINGLCASLIQRSARLAGKEPFGLVSEDSRTTPLLSKLYLQQNNEFPTEGELKELRTRITCIKNNLLTQEEIEAADEGSKHPIAKIYAAYNDDLRQHRLMDFDDQLVYAWRLLKKYPDLLSECRCHWPYLCVDEAQDTSKVQHMIILLLAKENRSLFMVGDEDQSIYGFRAAWPKALLDFESTYPGAKVLLMEENYRSCPQIVQAADAFIQRNVLRHEKHMRPVRPDEGRLQTVQLKNRCQQYQYLADELQTCRKRTAVLYRNNESAIPLVDLLERQRIPFNIRNADLSFFTHRIVQDILNIIRFAQEQTNTDLFMNLYFKLGTMIKKTDAMALCSICRRTNRSILELGACSNELPTYATRRFSLLREKLYRLAECSPTEVLTRIIYTIGYQEYLQKMDIQDTKTPILFSLALNYTSLPVFLTRLEELKLIFQTRQNDPACPLYLSTIHASKGLEYHTVYLIDVEDGIFPESEEIKRKDNVSAALELLEEERRLFYVGVTRARDRLFLINGGWTSTFQNQFLGDKGQKLKILSIEKTPPGLNLTIFPDPKDFPPGTAVRHPKFGTGTILSCRGKQTAAVLFGNETRIMDLSYLVKA